jgi:hypothetical protein
LLVIHIFTVDNRGAVNVPVFAVPFTASEIDTPRTPHGKAISSDGPCKMIGFDNDI